MEKVNKEEQPLLVDCSIQKLQSNLSLCIIVISDYIVKESATSEKISANF